MKSMEKLKMFGFFFLRIFLNLFFIAASTTQNNIDLNNQNKFFQCNLKAESGSLDSTLRRDRQKETKK